MFKRGQRDHHLCAHHGSERLLRIVAIELRFHIQQYIGLARRGEHLRCVHTRTPWPCARNIRADTVGRLAQKAEARAQHPRQLQRQAVQSRGLRMMLRHIAEHNCNALTGSEALRHGLCRRIRRDMRKGVAIRDVQF